MKSLKIAALLCAATLASFTAFAADETFPEKYAGVDLNFQRFDDGSDVATPLAVTAKVGGFFHQHLAAEARLGFGVASDSVNGVDYINNYNIGGYIRAVAQVEKLSPYLICGFTVAQATASLGSDNYTENKTGISYGAGFDYNFSEKYAVSAEWLKLVDNGDFDLSSINVGLKYKF